MIERNVHHQGNIPSRTCMGNAEQDGHTGWWRISFETWRGIPGDEYRVTTCTSAPLFDSEDAAYAAGDRALDMLQATGKFPNMCEIW